MDESGDRTADEEDADSLDDDIACKFSCTKIIEKPNAYNDVNNHTCI